MTARHGIGEAVAEIEACRMAATLAVAIEREERRAGLLLSDIGASDVGDLQEFGDIGRRLLDGRAWRTRRRPSVASKTATGEVRRIRARSSMSANVRASGSSFRMATMADASTNISRSRSTRHRKPCPPPSPWPVSA